jgi:hypothetical protein
MKINTESLTSKLITAYTFEKEVTAEYNLAVLEMEKTGKNLFTWQLLEAMITSKVFVRSENQLMAISTVAENLTKKAINDSPYVERTIDFLTGYLTVEITKKPTYKPDWASHPEANAWAIDKDGVAWYYENVPVRKAPFWSVINGYYASDPKFDKALYPEMVKDGAWERSLLLKVS